MAGIGVKIKSVFKRNELAAKNQEWISICGFVIPFIALSFSRYKLPHYIFPLFPFAAIIVADYFAKHAKMLPRWFKVVHYIAMHILIILAALIMIWVFPTNNILILGLSLLFYGVFWLGLKSIKDDIDGWIFPTLSVALLLQFVLSLHFYPRLLEYQSSSVAGKLIAKEKPAAVFWYKKEGHAMDYYSGRIIPELNQSKIDFLSPGALVYTNEEGLKTLRDYRIVKELVDYPVTLLRLPFLDQEKRHRVVKKNYIIEILPR